MIMADEDTACALADALFTAGYIAAEKRKDYDPRNCDEWQAVVDMVKTSSIDSERIDWMCNRGARILHSDDGEYCNIWLPAVRDELVARPAEGYPQKMYHNCRDAIDAVMFGKRSEYVLIEEKK